METFNLIKFGFASNKFSMSQLLWVLEFILKFDLMFYQIAFPYSLFAEELIFA